MRRLSLVLGLVLTFAAGGASAGRPAKRKPVRRPPPAGAPAPAPEESAPDETMAPGDTSASDKTPEAPPPEAAPAPKTAPKPVEEAPPSAAESEPAPKAGPPIDLAKLRADYDRLRDELFRSRSRAALVQEGLYASRLGARLEWKAAPDYQIRHAEVRLDGGTIWDSGDKPVTDDLVKVADRPIKPGPHSLTLRLEIRPGTKKKGKDIEGMGYVAEHTFAIVVPDNKLTTVVFTGDEDGDLPEYEPELEMELETETIKK
jgi:hypothetical protein